MLLLTRRIGNKVVVTVLGVNGNQVRLGIDAPAEITILREEIAAHDPGPGDRKKPSPSIRKRMPE